MPIPIMLLVDVEPDPRLVNPDDPAPWLGYESSIRYFNGLRDRLAKTTGSPVHFNWFFRMDPQIDEVYGSPAWAFHHYSAALQSLLGHGDEIGLHTHAYRWEKDKHQWLVDHGNQEWVNHCLDMSFRAYAEELNRPCEAFRFGDRFMNNEVMRRVEGFGARYELTLEPGTPPMPHTVPSEPHTGSLPDFRHVPTQPYRRDDADWTRPATASDSGMTVIPLSSGPPETWRGRTKRKLLRMLGQSAPPPQSMTLRLARHSPTVCTIMDHLLHEIDQPYLALLVRSDAAMKENERKEMDLTFNHIMNHRYASDFAFSTPREGMVHLGFEG
jgi:hypothetical protein